MPSTEPKKLTDFMEMSPPIKETDYIKVAVGVIKNENGEVLISQRGGEPPMGGVWEFAGGKFEDKETAQQALRRELQEELSIEVITAKPLLTLKYQYPDMAVKLYVFVVEQFAGEVASTLGQVCRWVSPPELNDYPFLAANKAIICAVQLPPFYAIIDDDDENRLMRQLDSLLSRGIRLIQARLKRMSAESIERFLAHAYPLCRQKGVYLLINSAVKRTGSGHVDGLHLTARDLMACQNRPKNYKWVAASCHNPKEMIHAQTIGVDFVVLSPVQVTASHPDTIPLGWTCFSQMVASCNIPVYGLGGLGINQLSRVRQMGGQGVAAIRAFSL